MYSYDYCGGSKSNSFLNCTDIAKKEGVQKIIIRHGFYLIRHSIDKAEDSVFLFSSKDEFLNISYCVSGKLWLLNSKNCDQSAALEIISGRYAMSYCSESSTISIKGCQFPLKFVSLCVSLSQLEQYICISPFYQKLNSLFLVMRKDKSAVEAVTPLVLDIPLRQILEYPSYLGMMNLFMEYKALEVLYTQMNLIDDTAKEGTHLAPYEYEAAIKAHEVLLNNIVEPPSLQTVARQVGMTHTRLNKVFRYVFGNTVFGVLRGERLECARRMLGETRKSVAEVAYACGFSSPSHLSRLFLGAYGVQPKRYQSERSLQGNVR